MVVECSASFTIALTAITIIVTLVTKLGQEHYSSFTKSAFIFALPNLPMVTVTVKYN